MSRVYAIVDSLSALRATDVLLFSPWCPRRGFVFQPRYAAYLNLIAPWWKALRSLALMGCRFETWEEVCRAVEGATAYWNKHRHPFIWGRGDGVGRGSRQSQASDDLPDVPISRYPV